MPTISLGFNDTIQVQKQIMVSMEVPLQENEHIWVWDHYFSYVLNLLSKNDESQKLMDLLTQWSQNFAKNMAKTYDELLANHTLTLSQNMQVVSNLEHCTQLFFIETSTQDGYWPNVHIKIPDDADPSNIRDSVFALAEYFLINNQHFYRELPLHMLAMRKYYQDELPFSDDISINQAPAYAFDTAFKFFQRMEQAKNNT